MRRVSLLGATGSIGTQTLDVIRDRRDRFQVVALAAGGGQPELLAQQVLEFGPGLVAVAREDAAAELRREVTRQAGIAGIDAPAFELRVGDDGIRAAAQADCDVVVNAITGAAGLIATLATLDTDATLALANKESLVIGGRLVIDKAKPGQIINVDSEHSAFEQALRGGRADEVRRLILTASGGPFRGKTREQMRDVTVAQALAHPTWSMGRVITLNSATLVNKGLELIEAGLLYGVDFDAVQVVVHPQSIVHSAVEYHDGSTIAQCSPPDMRLAIALALDWPRRLADAVPTFDWTQPQAWTFEPLDSDAFPAVELARRCGKLGGTAPAVYNAANEVAVDAFCAGRLSFLGIVDLVTRCVEDHVRETYVGPDAVTIDAVLAADAWAREHAESLIQRGFPAEDGSAIADHAAATNQLAATTAAAQGGA